MPPVHEPIIGLPDFKIISATGTKTIEFEVEYTGRSECPHCQSPNLRKKETFHRRLRHHMIGINKSVLLLKTHKFQCRGCKKYFNQRPPGILKFQRVSEPFKEQVALRHHEGTSKQTTARALGVGTATVERYYQRYLKLQASESSNASCPKVLGIDEKHFNKKSGYMTTLVNLKSHKVFDITLGRSEESLKKYMQKLSDRANCRVIVMDLSKTFRNIAKKYFPSPLVVADRFHVVRMINHHFLKTWSLLDEEGRKSQGLISMMRRHEWSPFNPKSKKRLETYLKANPALDVIYEFKQRLMKLILSRVSSKDQAKPLVTLLLEMITLLQESKFKPMVTLGNTLNEWKEEIVRMWRFSKTNSITEGLHRRMDEILNRAYGMRNFENFRIRVKAFCG